MEITQTNTAVEPTSALTAGNAIEVSHLTKRFRVRHQGAGTLKRAILDARQNLKRTITAGQGKPYIENKFALNDISFTVPHGQTLAVIGSNGSGKSTLLSILARVYTPTEGSVFLYNQQGGRARIAPLLALGAGFHPELTGYENIAFYGAVLGMNLREIRERQDAIIEFAALEEKVDTPLHGWNDGAKLRLGFAIAIHTEPDILLVDEVLAVGDEAFQNKCYRRIAQLQAQGKTILFVSHDLSVVERVAGRILWLNKSVIQMDGDVPTVLRTYREASALEE